MRNLHTTTFTQGTAETAGEGAECPAKCCMFKEI